MASKALPSPEVLRQLLRYDAKTGKLFWKERPIGFCPSEGEQKRWNAQFAGKEAIATKDKDGYGKGTIFARHVRAHVVVWAIVYGAWPEQMIDHINGDSSDNRIENLRLATAAQNMRNSKSNRGSSRFKGVTWHKRDKCWQASIRADGATYYLGNHTTEEAAAMAYNTAALRHHGEFARLNTVI